MFDFGTFPSMLRLLMTYCVLLLSFGFLFPTAKAFEVVDPIQYQNNIQYVSTGQGDTQLDPRWKSFPLKIIMIKGPQRKKDTILHKGINLKLHSQDQKKLLDVKNVGPWFFANLPPGDYYVYSKDSRGIDRNITIRVHGKKNKQDIYYIQWPL